MFKKRIFRFGAIALTVVFTQAVLGATSWSESTHQLAFGDFNGDGRSDVLYIAKDHTLPSGIALSEGSSPAIHHQSWASNYLGIPWHSGTYQAIVADFNGDSRADILLQRQSQGDHYLLLANSTGQITAITQTIASNMGGQVWSPDSHRLVVGDFDGNGRRDVFMQAVSPSGLSAVYLSSTSGTFSSPQQTWGNTHMGFKWSLRNAVIHAGDFNGDARTDLLVQARPGMVIVDHEAPFPVPSYRAGSFGIVAAKALSGGEIFYSPALQIWDRNYLGIDWSPVSYDIVVGNFDGDGTNRDDIFLQGRSTGRRSRLLLAGFGGQFISGDSLSAETLLAGLTADQSRLHPARFANSGPVGLYLQAMTESGTNQIVASVSGGSPITHDPNLINVVTPGTAVGALPGSFSVEPNGAAAYRVPISVPPGVARIQPSLGLSYLSRSGNGAIGVGWQLTGLSSIARCATTVAQDGIGNQDGADFDVNDAFCMDGQRLIAVTGANGSPGSKYRTEVESFQEVVSSGSTQGNPDLFTVRDNNGLTRSYGSMLGGEDSRFEARRSGASGWVAVWALQRVLDRFDNFVEYRYEQEANSLEYRPREILYGSKYSTARTVVGRVVFEYTDRNDSQIGYIVGGFKSSLTKRLQKISIFGRANPTVPGANDRVSQYFFNYEYSSTTGLSHLASLVLCDGGAGAAQRCLASTRFQWQYGYRGFSNASVATDVDLGSTVDLKMLDADGDGRSDYVYRHTSGSHTGQWLVRYASLTHSKYTGGYFATGIGVQQPNRAFAMDWNNDGYKDLVDSTTSVSGSAGYAGNYRVWLGSPTGLSSSNFAQGAAAEGLTWHGLGTVVGDFDGDGRQDIAYTPTADSSEHRFSNTLKVSLNNALSADSGLWGGSIISVTLGSGVSPTGGLWELVSTRAEAMVYDSSSPYKDEPTTYAINFDGDGRDDILVRVNACYRREVQSGWIRTCQPQFHVYSLINGALQRVWAGAGGPASELGAWGARHLKLGDFNGDGITDVLSWGWGFTFNAGFAWNLHLGTASKGVGVEAFTNVWAASSNSPTEQCDDADFSIFNLPGAACVLGTVVQLTEPLLDSTIPVDYNRDGYTDLLFADNGGWRVLPGSPTGFSSKVIITGREARQPKLATVVDDGGDGLPDILFPWGPEPENNWHIYYGRGPAVSGVIENITDGLGAQTQIQYAVTTASTDQTNYTGTVYKGHTRFPEDPASATLGGFRTVLPLGWPNAHFAAPLPVVYQYSVDNGIGTAGSASGGIRTKLQYWGLKFNRQGRGQLGFSEIRAWNDNSEIETRTRYAQQSFPHIGRILTTERRLRDQATYAASLAAGPSSASLYFNYTASCDSNPACPEVTPQVNTGYNENAAYNRVSFTTYILGARAAPGTAATVYLPYTRKTIEEVHPVSSGIAGSSPHKRVVSELLANPASTADAEFAAGTNPVDQHGNAGATRVTTTNGAAGGDAVSRDEHVILTTVVFANDESNWCISRPTSSSVVMTKPSSNSTGNSHARQSVTRAKAFTYSNCNLETESDDSGVTKTYAYDTFGNVASETLGYVGLPQNESRLMSSSYAATQGQFPSEIRNALGHLTAVAWDGRFGAQKSISDPNGITSQFQIDSLGRKVREIPVAALPAAYTDVTLYWCANTAMCWDGRGVFSIRTAKSDGGLSYTEFDRVGRPVSTRKLGFDGSWVASEVFFDPLARPYLTSMPYKPATQSSRCWNLQSYDQLDRVTSTWSSYANSECTSAPLPITGMPNGGRQTQTIYDLITADGNTTKTIANSSDTSSFATARVAFTTVNVMGRVRFAREELAPGGCPSNGNSIASNTTSCLQVEYDYDAQGNMTYTRQAGGLGTVTATPSTMVETKLWFNTQGRRTQIADPDLGNWSYTYTGFGEPDTQTDAKGQVTDFGYDRLGRVTTRTERASGGALETSTSLTYDSSSMGIGKISTATSSNGYSEWTSYDSLGRFEQARRLIDGAYYCVNQTYDWLGRPEVLKYPGSVAGDTSSTPEADSNRLRVRSNYNGYGYQASVQDVATGTVYWRADSVNEYGAVTQETLGNGLATRRLFDRPTAYLSSIKTGSAANDSSVQSLDFTFDQAANLRTRKDSGPQVNAGSGIREEYDYDKLYRLKQMRQYKPAASAGPAVSTENYAYDDFGNLLSKGTSYTDYCYIALGAANDPCAGVTSQWPHAAKRIRLGATSRDFTLDPNGNVASATNALFDSVSWYVSNLPKRISKGARYSEFTYGADRGRIKQYQYRASNDTESTTYFGALYEKASRTSGGSVSVEHTHYIYVGGDAVALAKRVGTGSLSLRYIHRDQLGSVVSLTNETGALVERSAFDPWGKRTNYATWDPTTPGTSTVGGSGAGGVVNGVTSTNRGFSSHEHVEGLGFVHMNGRVYDNEAGRFFSADPYVQFPLSTQGLNRYSYVGNNPLSYTDLSGYYIDNRSLGEVLFQVGDVISKWGGWWTAAGNASMAVGGYLKNKDNPDAWMNWLSSTATYNFDFSVSANQNRFVGWSPPMSRLPAGAISLDEPYAEPADESAPGTGWFSRLLRGYHNLEPSHDSYVRGTRQILGNSRRYDDVASEIMTEHTATYFEVGGRALAEYGNQYYFHIGTMAIGELGGEFALGRLALKVATHEVALTAKSASTSLSTYRYTQAGEKFIRYESANPAFSRVTAGGGVRPGTFAAPVSDGIIPVGQRVSTYNLPHPSIPRTNYVILEPPSGTLIVGPGPVMGGTGNEVVFPIGF